MFSNIGKKIMNLATITCVIGIVISVIAGCLVLGDSFISGLLIMILGALGSWVGSFVLFGFGRLIDNSSMICYIMGHSTEPDFEPSSYSSALSYQKPAPQQTYSAPRQTPSATYNNSRPAQKATPDSWTCKCGRVHMNYVSSCICGVSKREIVQ